jgi:hypothetical protein
VDEVPDARTRVERGGGGAGGAGGT